MNLFYYTQEKFASNISNLFTLMRIGKQGIPLYFRWFKGVFKDTFNINIILDGILFFHNLLKTNKLNLFFSLIVGLILIKF